MENLLLVLSYPYYHYITIFFIVDSFSLSSHGGFSDDFARVCTDVIFKKHN